MKFNHISISLQRGWRDKYHNYKFGGEIYPGMTNVLQETRPKHKMEGLDNWKKNTPHSEYIMKFAADIGTDTHRLIENYLSNVPTEPSHLLSLAHFTQLKPFLDKINNILGLEVFLYSRKLKVAGTVDTVAEYDGKLSIIDYKTKRSNQTEEYLHDAFVQATGYSIMWEEMTRKKIEQVVILVSSEKMQVEAFVKNPEDYKQELQERISRYNQSNPSAHFSKS